MIVIPLWFYDTGGFKNRFGTDTSKQTDSGDIEELKKKTPKNIEAVVTDREVVVYKWLDAHGVMQFSSVPPAGLGETDGEDGVEKMVLSPNTNVIDAIKMPKEEARKTQKSKVISLGSPYSVEGMKDMVNDSMQLQQQLNEQQAGQQEMMEELFKDPDKK